MRGGGAAVSHDSGPWHRPLSLLDVSIRRSNAKRLDQRLSMQSSRPSLTAGSESQHTELSSSSLTQTQSISLLNPSDEPILMSESHSLKDWASMLEEAGRLAHACGESQRPLSLLNKLHQRTSQGQNQRKWLARELVRREDGAANLTTLIMTATRLAIKLSPTLSTHQPLESTLSDIGLIARSHSQWLQVTVAALRPHLDSLPAPLLISLLHTLAMLKQQQKQRKRPVAEPTIHFTPNVNWMDELVLVLTGPSFQPPLHPSSISPSIVEEEDGLEASSIASATVAMIAKLNGDQMDRLIFSLSQLTSSSPSLRRPMETLVTSSSFQHHLLLLLNSPQGTRSTSPPKWALSVLSSLTHMKISPPEVLIQAIEAPYSLLHSQEHRPYDSTNPNNCLNPTIGPTPAVTASQWIEAAWSYAKEGRTIPPNMTQQAIEALALPALNSLVIERRLQALHALVRHGIFSPSETSVPTRYLNRSKSPFPLLDEIQNLKSLPLSLACSSSSSPLNPNQEAEEATNGLMEQGKAWLLNSLLPSIDHSMHDMESSSLASISYSLAAHARSLHGSDLSKWTARHSECASEALDREIRSRDEGLATAQGDRRRDRSHVVAALVWSYARLGVSFSDEAIRQVHPRLLSSVLRATSLSPSSSSSFSSSSPSIKRIRIADLHTTCSSLLQMNADISTLHRSGGETLVILKQWLQNAFASLSDHLLLPTLNLKGRGSSPASSDLSPSALKAQEALKALILLTRPLLDNDDGAMAMHGSLSQLSLISLAAIAYHQKQLSPPSSFSPSSSPPPSARSFQTTLIQAVIPKIKLQHRSKEPHSIEDICLFLTAASHSSTSLSLLDRGHVKRVAVPVILSWLDRNKKTASVGDLERIVSSLIQANLSPQSTSWRTIQSCLTSPLPPSPLPCSLDLQPIVHICCSLAAHQVPLVRSTIDLICRVMEGTGEAVRSLKQASESYAPLTPPAQSDSQSDNQLFNKSLIRPNQAQRRTSPAPSPPPPASSLSPPPPPEQSSPPPLPLLTPLDALRLTWALARSRGPKPSKSFIKSTLTHLSLSSLAHLTTARAQRKHSGGGKAPATGSQAEQGGGGQVRPACKQGRVKEEEEVVEDVELSVIVGRCFWSLGKLGANPSKPQFASLMRSSEPLLKGPREPSPSTMAHISWGVARLTEGRSWGPGGSWLTSLLLQLDGSVRRMGPTQVAHVTWAMAKIRLLDQNTEDARDETPLGPRIIQGLISRSSSLMGSFDPDSLGLLVYGLAGLGWRPPQSWTQSFVSRCHEILLTSNRKEEGILLTSNRKGEGLEEEEGEGGGGFGIKAMARVAWSLAAILPPPLPSSSPRQRQTARQSLPAVNIKAFKDKRRPELKKRTRKVLLIRSVIPRPRVIPCLVCQLGKRKTPKRAVRRRAMATQRVPDAAWLTLLAHRAREEMGEADMHDLALLSLGLAILCVPVEALGRGWRQAFAARVRHLSEVQRSGLGGQRDLANVEWAWKRLMGWIRVGKGHVNGMEIG